MTAPPTRDDMQINSPVGETLAVLERVIVAPATGIFQRLDVHAKVGGDLVNRGDAIGVVRSLGVSTPIQSPFDGLLVAVLASEGERMRCGQPVAWLRVR